MSWGKFNGNSKWNLKCSSAQPSLYLDFAPFFWESLLSVCLLWTFVFRGQRTLYRFPTSYNLNFWTKKGSSLSSVIFWKAILKRLLILDYIDKYIFVKHLVTFQRGKKNILHSWFDRMADKMCSILIC